MKHPNKLIALALSLSAFSCDVSKLGLDSGAKEETKKSESSPLSAKLEKNGYYLDFTRFDESKIPDELKDKVAVFQIALQSGDQPVLGGRIESFEPGNCTVTDVPWATPAAGEGGVATATIASPASTGTGETPVGTQLTASDKEGPAVCVDKKIEQFGPNDDSNFFSIVINKSRTIALNVFANGYQSKIVIIDGSKAKFIVLNIDLGLAMEPCYFSKDERPDSPVSSTDASGASEGSGLPPRPMGIHSGAGGGAASPGAIAGPAGDDTKPWTCGPIMLPPVPVPPGPVPTPCEDIYAPVCGTPSANFCGGGANGRMCPQIAPAPTTYANKCTMEAAGATLIHGGECTAAENPTTK